MEDSILLPVKDTNQGHKNHNHIRSPNKVLKSIWVNNSIKKLVEGSSIRLQGCVHKHGRREYEKSVIDLISVH